MNPLFARFRAAWSIFMVAWRASRTTVLAAYTFGPKMESSRKVPALSRTLGAARSVAIWNLVGKAVALTVAKTDDEILWEVDGLEWHGAVAGYYDEASPDWEIGRRIASAICPYAGVPEFVRLTPTVEQPGAWKLCVNQHERRVYSSEIQKALEGGN